jgi:hypothetical protein
LEGVLETEREWTCRNCPETRFEDLHPYTQHLLCVRMLRVGGYPLKQEDLSIEEWLDLGFVERTLNVPSDKTRTDR